MIKAYEYRIYPTPQQEELFNQTLGLCRLYWNIVVFNKNQNHNMQIEGYKPTFQKYKPEALEWIQNVDSVPLGQMWSDVRAAYTNFFKSLKYPSGAKYYEVFDAVLESDSVYSFFLRIADEVLGDYFKKSDLDEKITLCLESLESYGFSKEVLLAYINNFE